MKLCWMVISLFLSSPTEEGLPSLYTGERTLSITFHGFYGSIKAGRPRQSQGLAAGATAAAAAEAT